MADPRSGIYGDLHHGALQSLEAANANSARTILALLFERWRPQSILDVGCGIGTWLQVAEQMGVEDIQGVEGQWLDPHLARIPAGRIATVDLERPFDLGRRFGLAVSIEVAEHLSPAAAPTFVGCLARHSDVVLFSAAIPFQGGDHHVNEQFPDYWSALFARHGYLALDIVRPEIWRSPDILVWLRQNLMLFATHEFAGPGGPFGAPPQGPLSIVHPEVYRSLAERANGDLQDYRRMLEWLSSGKTLSATPNPDGTLAITVADKPEPD